MADLVETHFKEPLNPDENGERAYRKNKDLVIKNAGGMCVVKTPACTVRATTAHHIEGRRVRNPHAIHRLLATCDPCHNGSKHSIHANPAWAVEQGYMRSRTS